MNRIRSPISPSGRRALKRALLRVPRVRRTGRTVILCYHSVHPSKEFASAHPELFEQHILWLKEQCEVVPLNTVFPRTAEADRDRPVVAITFDDGYEDNYTWAFPVLVRNGIPATFFVTSGFIDRDESVVKRFQALRDLPSSELEPLSWGQIGEMSNGGMDIGAHSVSHPNFRRLGESEAVDELRGSKQRIESRLGKEVDHFAWPFGKPRIHYTRESIDLARGAGYSFGVSVCSRGVRATDEPLALPRFFVTRDSIELLEAKIRGRFDPISLWQEHAPLWLMRRLSPEDERV